MFDDDADLIAAVQASASAANHRPRPLAELQLGLQGMKDEESIVSLPGGSLSLIGQKKYGKGELARLEAARVDAIDPRTDAAIDRLFDR